MVREKHLTIQQALRCEFSTKNQIWLPVMRLTDFWDRMEQALGAAYARSWAADFHVPSLDGKTVDQALAQGVDTQTVWRAVHQTLDLHPKYR
jgi:Protein of unknown function (DUF3046)